MEQLIAKDEEEYVSKAVGFSSNRDKFMELRKSVFLNAIKSPLFNKKQFAKNFYNSLKEIIK